MKCLRCGRETRESTTVQAVELAHGGLLVIRNVPCLECVDCGEIHYTGDVAERLEQIVDEAERLSQELMVIDYRRYTQAA